MAKLTAEQTQVLDRLRNGSPVLRVEFFDHCMDGKVALVQRVIRERQTGHSWSDKTRDEMYRVDPAGKTWGV